MHVPSLPVSLVLRVQTGVEEEVEEQVGKERLVECARETGQTAGVRRVKMTCRTWDGYCSRGAWGASDSTVKPAR